MPHFYVRSGNFRTETDSPSHRDAALAAFRENLDPLIDQTRLSVVTSVSHVGFEGDPHDDDMWFDTVHLLQQSGLEQFFRTDPNALPHPCPENN